MEFRPRERTSFQYYVECKQIGERVELVVLRGGKELSLSVKLTKPACSFFLVPAPEHDVMPSYYIFLKRCEGEEVVLLLRVLAVSVNEGYHDVGDWIVEWVNGRRVKNLRELIRLAEEGDSPFVVFENSCGEEIVKAQESRQEILRRYHIPRDLARR